MTAPFSRKLTRPGKEKIDTRVIFTDTETTSDVGHIHLILGCYEIWETDDKGMPRYKWGQGTYHTIDEFYLMLRANLPCRVVAHNWKFDAAVLLVGNTDNMAMHGYSINAEKSILPGDGRNFAPFLLTLEFVEGSATLICNTNFYKQSLESIGDSLGIDKLAMPLPDRYGSRAEYLGELEYYCKRDVEILRMAWFFMFSFTQELAGTTPGITAAMAANRVFRAGFMPENVEIQGTLGIPYISDAESDAYRGGRTDTFFKGTPKAHTVYKYDINSLYPSVMLGDMPIRYVQRAPIPEMVQDIRQGLGMYLYLVDATVKIEPEGRYGFLGCEGIKTDDGQFIFPVGEYRTWLWQPMVELMLEQGYIKYFHSAYAYNRYPIFDDYIISLYACRQEYKKSGDTSRDMLVKLMLNSLYGKFGQRNNVKWELIEPSSSEYTVMANTGDDRFTAAWEGVYKEYMQIGSELYALTPEHPTLSRNSVCAIAGYITSKARATLWKGLAAVIDKGGELYMCDTDSVVCSVELPPEMVSDTELGKFKLEDTVPGHTCVFVAPKHYEMEGRIRIKGIRNPDTIMGDYEQVVFPNFVTDMVSRNPVRRERLQSGAVITRLVKSPTGDNNKRIEQGDGLPTLPIRLTALGGV